MDARDRHLECELGLGDLGGAGDRSRAAWQRGAGERNVSLAREKAGRSVEADPSRAGHVRFAPCVQVGEVLLGTRRPVEGFAVGGELDEIARSEACGDPEVAQDLHQQPRRVAARALALLERLLRRENPRLHPDQIVHVAAHHVVHGDEKIDGGDGGPEETRARLLHPRGEARRFRHQLEIRRQLARVLVVVEEGEVLGGGVDEEIERVDDRHVGHQVDSDLELARLLRKHQARHPVAVRILLPVEEVLRRLDAQRVAVDGRAAMRRGPQSHLVRRHPHGPIERVERPVVQRNLDGHSSQSGSGSSLNTLRRPPPQRERSMVK